MFLSMISCRKVIYYRKICLIFIFFIVQIGKENYTIFDGSLSCRSQFYRERLLPIVLIGITILVFFVPAFISFKMRNLKKKKGKLNLISTLKVYGSMILEIKKKYAYWDIITNTLVIIFFYFLSFFFFDHFFFDHYFLKFQKNMVILISVLLFEFQGIRSCFICVCVLSFYLGFKYFKPYFWWRLKICGELAVVAQICCSYIVIISQNQ